MSKEKIVGVTPVRGGSKRIPHKNLMVFKGKPLLKQEVFDLLSPDRDFYSGKKEALK